MAHQDPDRYVTRLDHTSTTHVHDLIKTDRLKPSQITLQGWYGATIYRPVDPITAHSDHQLRVGGVPLRAQMYALPSAPYEAVVRASPEYRQPHGMADLGEAFNRPGQDAEQFRGLLRAALIHPVPIDQTAHLASKDHGCQATWLPDRTLFVEQDGLWFVAMAFRLKVHVGRVREHERVPFGIDVNADPMLCMVDARGDVRMVGHPHALLDALRRDHCRQVPGGTLTLQEVRVLRALAYAAGRAPLEAALTHLLVKASVVGVERLTTAGMQKHFVADSREQAAFDWLFAWLPQAAYRAGVRVERVDPEHTSQICHRHTHVRGRLQGREFHCPECGTPQHRDVNAAHNILARIRHARR